MYCGVTSKTKKKHINTYDWRGIDIKLAEVVSYEGAVMKKYTAFVNDQYTHSLGNSTEHKYGLVILDYSMPPQEILFQGLPAENMDTAVGMASVLLSVYNFSPGVK